MTINTITTSANGPTEGTQNVGMTSDGTMWAMARNVGAAPDRFEFWYSTDDGATWTENTDLRFETGDGEAMFAINSVNDNAVAIFNNNGSSSNEVLAISGLTTSSSAWTENTISWGGRGTDLLVFDKPSSTNFYAVWNSYNTFFNTDYLSIWEFDNTGTSVGSVTSFSLGTGASGFVGLDFHHTGDGSTVKGGTPHIYAGFPDSGDDLSFKKFTYSSGSWTAGSTTTFLSNTIAQPVSVAYDGDDAVIVAVLDSRTPRVWERDEGDTTSTDHTADVPSRTWTDADSIMEVTAHGDGFTLWAVDPSGDWFGHADYSRSGDSWTGWTSLGTPPNTPTERGFSALRAPGPSAYAFCVFGHLTSDALYTSALLYNTAPNAPVLVSPIAGATVDQSATITLDWTFSDPDAGDTQSEFDLRYRIVGAGAWTDVNSVTATTSYDITAATLTADETYEWEVRTYDSQGTVGAWSGVETFNPTEPPTAPTFTAPAAADQVIALSFFNVGWTASEQDAYQLRRVADDTGSPDTSTVYSDTGTVSAPSARSRSVEFPTNSRFEHIQLRVQKDGLWSSWSSIRVEVDYTVPPASTVTITAVSAAQALQVNVTAGTPAGLEPTPTVYDLYVRIASGGRADLDRPVGGSGIRIAQGVAVADATVDYRVVEGFDYEYLVRTFGENGTYIDSSWITTIT